MNNLTDVEREVWRRRGRDKPWAETRHQPRLGPGSCSVHTTGHRTPPANPKQYSLLNNHSFVLKIKKSQIKIFIFLLFWRYLSWGRGAEPPLFWQLRSKKGQRRLRKTIYSALFCKVMFKKTFQLTFSLFKTFFLKFDSVSSTTSFPSPGPALLWVPPPLEPPAYTETKIAVRSDY